jgi:hypothetical protein
MFFPSTDLLKSRMGVRLAGSHSGVDLMNRRGKSFDQRALARMQFKSDTEMPAERPRRRGTLENVI